jgi:hypothetical protein
MKYCSSVVIGGIDAYLYHMGDEFSKAFDFHQADLVHVHTHGRLFTSHASCLSGNGTRKFSYYFQIYTNLLIEK